MVERSTAAIPTVGSHGTNFCVAIVGPGLDDERVMICVYERTYNTGIIPIEGHGTLKRKKYHQSKS